MASNPFTTTVAAYAALSGLAAKSNGQVLDASETNELKEAAKRFNSWVRGNAEMAAGVALEVPILGVGSTVKIRADTLSNLKALGTDDGLAVGDVAWDTTGKRFVSALTAAAGSSTWGIKSRFTIHTTPASTSTSADERFLSFGSSTVGSLINNFGIGTIFRHPTTVYGCMFWVENDPGNVTIKAYKEAVEAASKTETVAAATPKDFVFATPPTYAAGERFDLGIDPTNARTASEESHLALDVEQTITL